MTTIRVYDPALCCSSGVCGTDPEAALTTFAADYAWARERGADIERFNLAQQPTAFTENTTVLGFLERSGSSALPLVLVNGDVALAGRYPSRDELRRWTGLGGSVLPTVTSCCSGTDGCC
jgi:hypothetical protein